jgi:aspartate 1-decarboxylase
VILASYAVYEEDEARRHVPAVVLVDGANRIVARTPAPAVAAVPAVEAALAR